VSATRLLWLAAAVCGLGGAALRVAPPAPVASTPAAPAGARAPALARPAGRRAPPADAAREAPVVQSNIFSASRTPPEKRYSPNAVDSAPPKPKAKKPAPPPIRVFGITKDARGGIAIIEADPKVRGPELYRLGDRLAGGRIASITDSSVIVVRPGGKVILPLVARERRK
jgi:hypothetical protein